MSRQDTDEIELDALRRKCLEQQAELERLQSAIEDYQGLLNMRISLEEIKRAQQELVDKYGLGPME